MAEEADDRNDRFSLEYGTMVTPSCADCKWRSEIDPTLCVAFPDGIPVPILTAEHDHKTPYKGDHGLLYEPKSGTT